MVNWLPVTRLWHGNRFTNNVFFRFLSLCVNVNLVIVTLKLAGESYPHVIHRSNRNWWITTLHLLDIICYNRSGVKWGGVGNLVSMYGGWGKKVKRS